jgi:RNA polymerase sigma-70 factor (ECF subfamily)
MIAPEVLDLLVANREAFLSFLTRRLRSPERAEEVLQQAFVRAIERGSSIQERENAVAWFYRLLRNAVVDHVRRDQSADRALRRWADESSEEVTAPEREKNVCRCVSQLVGTLKPEYAAALQAVDVEGKTVSAFATEACIQPNNAAVRLHRARAALGQRLHARCASCASDGCSDCTCS